VLAVALPAALGAQSSQFGTRGLGLPGRGQSARALATGGSFALFDPLSTLNPAALGEVTVLTAAFTGLQNFRTSTAPSATVSGRDMRFPLMTITGPLGKLPMAAGFTFSNYTDRDFSVATTSELVLRDAPVTSFDTLTSRGGLGDIGLGAAYRGASGLRIGAAFHIITGSARTDLRRGFSDTAYRFVRQQAEISYAGSGVAVGVTRPVGTRITFAALARTDGRVRIDRDSTPVSRVGLPATLGAGVRWRPGSRLDLAAQAMYRTWSEADAGLIAGGGTGAKNTFDVAIGGEYTSDIRRPYRRPIRFGVHYSKLPFPQNATAQPTEFGVAAGTGVRFGQDRAGIDLALEHVWRREGSAYRESAWLLSVGVSVRPQGPVGR
nr:hypothetical protein [Gemmatimonadales bacterium]